MNNSATLVERILQLIYWLIAAAVLFFAIRNAIEDNRQFDLFVYRQGAVLALEGRTPYQVLAIQTAVKEQYPEFPKVHNNCGFFLAPQTLLVMAPFAMLDWPTSKLVWVIVMAVAAFASLWTILQLTNHPCNPLVLALVLAVVAGLRDVGWFILEIGQTSVFMLTMIVIGEVLFRRGQNRWACLAWAFVFIKPHLALGLIPLAWWRAGVWRCLEILFCVGVLNLLAGLIFFQDLWFWREFLLFVEQGHQTVSFNRLLENQQLTSWNRLLFAAGGPGFELGIKWTLLGYVVTAWLIWSRQQVSGTVDGNWILATTAASMMVCCQVLPHEMILLVLTIPYLAHRLTDDRVTSRLVAFLGLGLLCLSWNILVVAGDDGVNFRTWFGERIGNVLFSQRSLACAAFWLLVFGAGPQSASAPPQEPEKSAGQ